MIKRTAVLASLVIAALTLLAAVPASRVCGQTPTPSPSADELKLQEEKRLTELQRDIELAKKAIRDAQPKPEAKSSPPAPTATPLAGDTTLENVKLEAEMVAYKAMSEVADQISKEIKHTRGTAKNIAIYDAQVVKDWRFYQALFPAFKGQVDDILAQYKALLCDNSNPTITADVDASFLASSRCADPNRDVMTLTGGVQEAFSAGSTLLKSFIDLAALFRTDTKIQGMAFTVDESAMVAEVFRALKNDYGANNISLYYPEVFPPRLTKDSRTISIVGDLYIYKTQAEKVIKKKNLDKEKAVADMVEPTTKKAQFEEKLGQVEALETRLADLRRALKNERNPLLRKKIRSEIVRARIDLSKLGLTEASLPGGKADLTAHIEEQKRNLAPLEARIKQINADVKKLTSINERFLAFVTDFVKIDNGVNTLALFIKAEDIDEAMADQNSYWLEIKSVSAGGNNRTRKNLLRFLSGAKLDHSGGVIIEYTLYENSGAVVYSDKISVYEGYVEPKKIRGPKVFSMKDTVN